MIRKDYSQLYKNQIFNMEKKEFTVDNIREVLRGVYDPEIPANVVDLGLIYNIEILADNVVDVTMTLTAMGCPLISEFMESIKQGILDGIQDVKHVNVDITFDPPWNPSMINEQALFELGIQKPS